MSHPPQRMSQSPFPADQPGGVKIYYDVSDAVLPVELVVYGHPCGSKESFWVRGVEDAEFTVDLPAGCQGGLIEDASGQSMDYAIAINP